MLFVLSSDEYIDIKGINFAGLGGKLMLNKLQYTSQNSSLWVLEVSITINWWTRNPKHRISIELEGLEFFSYNSSARYDGLAKIVRESGINVEVRGGGEGESKGAGEEKSAAEAKQSEANNRNNLEMEDVNDPLPPPQKHPAFYRYAKNTKLTISSGQVYAGSRRLPTMMVLSFGFGYFEHFLGDVAIHNRYNIHRNSLGQHHGETIYIF